MSFVVDLHNHSCLSPCGSLELSPLVIADIAAKRGIQIMALTDHNSARNAPAWDINAREQGIIPMFGLEVTSFEEVHILCIFARPGAAMDFSDQVFEVLPKMNYNPDMLGDEVVVDEKENIIETLDYYLGMATDWTFEEVVARGRAAGAIVIPSHIDRPAFGAISQLGFLPEGDYDAVEVVRAQTDTGIYTKVQDSDAHQRESIGRRNFTLEADSTVLDKDGYINLEVFRGALHEKKVRFN